MPFVPANVGNIPTISKVVDNLAASGGDTLHNIVDVALWRLCNCIDRDERFYTFLHFSHKMTQHRSELAVKGLITAALLSSNICYRIVYVRCSHSF